MGYFGLIPKYRISKNGNNNYPYWARGWEEIFDNSSDIEKSVHYIDQMTQRVEKAKNTLRKKYKPFLKDFTEKF